MAFADAGTGSRRVVCSPSVRRGGSEVRRSRRPVASVPVRAAAASSARTLCFEPSSGVGTTERQTAHAKLCTCAQLTSEAVAAGGCEGTCAHRSLW